MNDVRRPPVDRSGAGIRKVGKKPLRMNNHGAEVYRVYGCL
jgi:hypothetical protein